MTIRARLTIWYGLTLMLLIAIAGLVVWWQVDVSLRESLERELRIRAADVAAGLEQGEEDEVGMPGPIGLGIFTVLVDPVSGATEASPGAPPALPELPEGASRRALSPDGPAYAFFTTTLSDGRLLITGSSLAHVEVSAARIPELLVTAGLLCALASLAGGWWLAGRALGPIRRLTEEADAIGPHDLTRRLPVLRQEDELGHLAATLNRLLGRIEDGVRRERAFIAGAAHDLRTPIAALRVRLDTLTQARSGELDRAAIEEARRDAVNLGDLADDLLGLAEAQAPGPADTVGDHVLPLLVARAEQEVEWLAHQRNISIEQAIDEVTVRISAVRFHQALTNLLANAVRHGPSDASVRIEARLVPGPDQAGGAGDGQPDSDASVIVEVADQGPGIDPGDRADLFVPFAIQRRGSGTHGLGLATAAAAVWSQGGEIGYRDGADGGSVFWFRLPIVRSTAALGHDGEAH